MVVESATKNLAVAIHSVREFSTSTPGELSGKDWTDYDPDHRSS